ncbi:metal ABC transporter permease [Pseudomonadota bacterium]
MDDFVTRALVAGIGVAILAGPLGCFIVWRRMAYFGTALAHAALLGIALGILLDISPNVGVLSVSVATALALLVLQRQRRLATDTLLGILAHVTLACGLVVLGFLDQVRVDLLGYLFGDILAVSSSDIYWIYVGGGLCLIVLLFIWQALLIVTVDEDLARADGVAVDAIQFIFVLLISMVIAVAMQIVGIMLIVSMFIIPAATSRRLTHSPETMAIVAAVVGIVSVLTGISASFQWDTPAGPSIVIAASLLFCLSVVVPLSLRRIKKLLS